MNNDQLLNQYRNHTGTLPSGAHFIKIGNTLCDVFPGKGWTSPTRFRLIKGSWVYQQGPRECAGTMVAELNG
jgi:hypothetical protein